MNGKDKVSLLCPSRGRPDAALRMAESALARAGDPDLVELLIYVDSDDPEREHYIRAFEQLGETSRIIVGIPRRPVSACNHMAGLSSGALMAGTPDDLVFETDGWEQKLLAATKPYMDRICLVFPDDGGRAGKHVATQPFITRRVHELLGYCLFPGCLHYSSDLWMHELFNRLGRLIHAPDVAVVHRHHDTGAAELDATYEWASPLQEEDTNLFITLSRWMPVDEQLLRAQMRPTTAELAAAAMKGRG